MSESLMMASLWVLTIFAIGLFALCGYYLNRAYPPISGQQAYDLKTIHRVRLTALILAVAGVINLFFVSEIQNTVGLGYGEFWLSYDLTVTLAILLTNSRRVFPLVITTMLLTGCYFHYQITEILSIRLLTNLESTSYMFSISTLNYIVCFAILWGGFDVLRKVKLLNIADYRTPFGGWVHANVLVGGERNYVNNKIKQKRARSQ